MKKYILILFVLLIGCRTIQTVQGPSTNHSTGNIDHSVQQNTNFIYVHDSTTITQKGDTIKIKVLKTIYVDRWHNKTDSIIKTDTLKVLTPIYKNVEIELTWFQSLMLWVGKIASGIIILIGLYLLAKFSLKYKI
jgi:hypothetical protein